MQIFSSRIHDSGNVTRIVQPPSTYLGDHVPGVAHGPKQGVAALVHGDDALLLATHAERQAARIQASRRDQTSHAEAV